LGGGREEEERGTGGRSGGGRGYEVMRGHDRRRVRKEERYPWEILTSRKASVCMKLHGKSTIS
jgi:hypothetical protein